LSRISVARFELGTREPVWSSLQALADALGVDCTAFQEPRRRKKK
jgi:hypothetical protein